MPSAEAEDEDCGQIMSEVELLRNELVHLRKAICIINHLAGHELDINCAMEAIRQVALDLLGCEKVTLFLVFKRRQELRATDLQYGNNVIRVKFGEGIAGTVAKTGRMMNVPDAYAHPLFHAQVDRLTGYRTRNILCASISDMNGRIVAVLQALNKEGGKPFTPADEHNIQLFSTHLGNTITKAKLHDKALREKQRVSDLYQTFKALSGARNLEEVLDLASCALHGILHASLVFVFILDTPRNELWANYSVGTEHHMVRVQMGQGLVGKAASENQAMAMSGSTPLRTKSGSAALAEPAAHRTHHHTHHHHHQHQQHQQHLHLPSVASSAESPPDLAAARALFTRLGSSTDPAAVPQPEHARPAVHIMQSGAGAAQQQAQPTPFHDVSRTPGAQSPPPLQPPQQQQQLAPAVDLHSIDPSLMRQIAPALQGEPVRSLLVQPLAVDEKVVGAILVINKNDSENDHDIFFEDCYTESDTKAMALFAYEISQVLQERSLECSIASALSIVAGSQAASMDAAGAGSPVEPAQAPAGEADMLLRSQMLTMYYQFPPGKRYTSYSGTSSIVPPLGSKTQVNFPIPRCCTIDAIPRRTSADMNSAPAFVSSGHMNLMESFNHRHGLRNMSQLSSLVGRQRRSSPQQHVRVRSHAVAPNTWSEAGCSSDSDISLDGVASAHECGGGGGGAELRRPNARSTDLATVSKSTIEARSLLDEVAPWVELGCSSGDSSSGGAGGGGGGGGGGRVAEDGGSSSSSSSSRSSAHRHQDQGEQQGAACSLGSAIESRAGRQHSVPFLARMAQPPALLAPDPAAAFLPSPHARRPLGGSPRGATIHSPPLLRAALAGSRKTSVQPTCSSPLPAALTAHSLQQQSGWWLGGVAGAPDTPFSATMLWDGRPCKQPTKFFPPELLCSWHFDFTAFGNEDLIKLCEDLFLLSGVVETFELDKTKLRCFIAVVAQHYTSAPYHNLNHVVHVLHSTWLMLGTPCVQDVLTPEDNLALLIAALCHDLGHDGFSNSYHVNTQSVLATIYNDISVQENHHCATCFSILRSKECALLEHTDIGLQRRLRKSIVGAIMSTDMAKHFEHCQAFNQHPPMYDKECEADRMLLMKVLLHAADIGNAVRPFSVNQIMSRRVHLEFEAQAHKEAAAGLPITFAVDSNNPRMCAQVELNFLDYVVSPLWTRLVEVMPAFAQQLNQLKFNRQRYEELAHAEPQ